MADNTSDSFSISKSVITLPSGASLVVNGSNGTNGQVLTTNGATVYWGNVVSLDAEIAYTNAVSYVDGKSYVNTDQLTANLSNYQTIAGLSATVATLASNNASYLGGTIASGYQTTAGLSSNIATLTANNTSFVGTVSAANVVSNAQLSGNLSNYQTSAGLASNVAKLTSNSTNFAEYLKNGARGYIPVQTANSLTTFISIGAADYILTSDGSYPFWNNPYSITVGTANNATNLGGVAAAKFVQNTDSRTLSGNLVLSGVNTSITGYTRFGSGSFSKAGFNTGDLLLDNGATDTPGILFYYGNNTNFGIDVESNHLRFVGNLNEVGGAVKGYFDTSGNFYVAGYLSPTAWTAGQVIKDTMLGNSEVTIVSTTIATSGTSTNFITYNYTPVSSSSYLIVHFHLSKYTPAGTTDDSWYSQLLVDGTEIAYGWQMVNDNGTGTSGRSGVLFPLTGRFTNSNTAVKQIQVAARRDSADDSISIDNSNSSMWLRITEVAR